MKKNLWSDLKIETTVEPIEITYTDENSVRVDQFLSQHFEISRAQSKALCKEGAVTLMERKQKQVNHLMKVIS